VSVINTRTRQEEEIRARMFAVCCASIESARLLLNSRSPQFPNGLANSSDLIGRYLTGHIGCTMFGYLEDLVGTAPMNNDGATDHSYIPRFNLNRPWHNYLGGYQYQIQFSNFAVPHQAYYLAGFGQSFKHQVRRLQPAFFHMGGFGKVLARRENRVTVDPKKPDAYGIPIPVVQCRFGDNDLALWKDMKERAKEILHTAKVSLVIDATDEPNGFASHETGTVRMGKNPRSSVLNSYCQAHEVKNLFVVDGSCFSTS